jgi:AcrR family transcriptional regulator
VVKGRRRLQREDWLAAALRAIERGGIGAVKVLPLAASLGASRGSFYWHFRDRDDLVEALLRYWESELTDAVIAHNRQETGSAQTRFRKLLEDVIGHRQGRCDPAVRALAIHDADAARVVRRADRTRLTHLVTLFREMGFSAAEADARSRLTLAYLVGDHMLLVKESAANRRRFMAIRQRSLTRR